MTKREKLEEWRRQSSKEIYEDFMDDKSMEEAFHQSVLEEEEMFLLDLEIRRNPQAANEGYTPRMPDCS